MNYYLLFVIITLAFSGLILFLTFEKWEMEDKYKSTTGFIQGQTTLKELKNLAPEGCKEGMHSANTCQILGMLSQQQEQLDRIKERLK